MSNKIEFGAFSKKIPRDLVGNLRYRRNLQQQLMSRKHGEDVAADVRMMSAVDPLFWCLTCAWTYDPRKRPSGIPFILYHFQEEGLKEILGCMGLVGNRKPEDLFVEKSRDMGVSWLILAAFMWTWDYVPGQTMMLMSRKEDLVDKPGDPDALFWKLDYLLEQTPEPLRARFIRSRLHIENLYTRSIIDGASTTADTGRGGRRSAALLDEFAAVENGDEVLSATADNTPCRIFASTPKGTANAQYKLKCNPEIKKLSFHWILHPEKSQGLYFDSDKKPRSPWYDAECKRRASRLEIAQELDLDYHVSGGTFFDKREIDRHIAQFGRDPVKSGTLQYLDTDFTPLNFCEENKGALRLWFNIDEKNIRPPCDTDYVIGIDVSAGVGAGGSKSASYSVASVWSVKSRDKVAVYRTNRRRPEEFARDVCALAKWFAGVKSLEGAFLLWERNGGPGTTFGQTLVSTGYRRMYYQENDKSICRDKGLNPGWHSARERKETLLSEYRREIAAMTVHNPSVPGLEETMSYVYLKNGGIGLPVGWWDKAPEEDQTRHGDEVMADALGIRAMKEIKLVTPEEEVEEKVGTFAWRRHQRELAHSQKEYW